MKDWEAFVAGGVSMKYVITTDGKVLVFDSEIWHSDMVESPDIACAGGFVSVGQRGVSCYGMSMTLGVESRSEDSILVRNELVKRLPAVLVEQLPPQK